MNFKSYALKYHEHGFRVIPVNKDKRPCNLLRKHDFKWEPFQTAQTVEDIEELFTPDSHGIAVMTGIGGLEVVDIDCKYSLSEGLETRFIDELDSIKCGVTIAELTMVKTRTGGFHVLYYCDSPSGNTKLASRPATPEEVEKGEKVKVLLETRGVGGYVVAWPTPGYEMYHGLMSGIRHVTMYERNSILNAARMLDEMPEIAYVPPERRTVAKEYSKQGKSVIEDFNERGDIPSMLQAHGWKFVKQAGNRQQYKRPGSTDAATSGNFHEEMNLFKSFSTSTEFVAEKAYDPFGVYAVLNHRGDMSAAAKKLYADGFGDRPTVTNAPSSPAPQPAKPLAVDDSDGFDTEEEEDIAAELEKRSFDIDAEPPKTEYTLRCTVDGQEYNVGGPGDIGLIEGLEKSRKSTFLKALVASALDDGTKRINFTMNLRGGDMVFLDTEQGARSFWRTHKQAHMMARLNNKPSFYRAYSLRDLDVDKRIRYIDWIIDNNRNLSVLVIDGILDLTKNFNNESQAQEITHKVMRWAEKSNAMIFCVIHQTKSNGYTIGHLGSMLNRKCSFSIEMVYDEDSNFTTVNSKLTRDTKRFKSFKFTQDDYGFPVMNHNEAYIVRDGIAIPKNEDHFSVQPITDDPEKPDPFAAPFEPTKVLTIPSKINDDEDIPF